MWLGMIVLLTLLMESQGGGQAPACHCISWGPYRSSPSALSTVCVRRPCRWSFWHHLNGEAGYFQLCSQRNPDGGYRGNDQSGGPTAGPGLLLRHFSSMSSMVSGRFDVFMRVSPGFVCWPWPAYEWEFIWPVNIFPFHPSRFRKLVWRHVDDPLRHLSPMDVTLDDSIYRQQIGTNSKKFMSLGSETVKHSMASFFPDCRVDCAVGEAKLRHPGNSGRRHWALNRASRSIFWVQGGFAGFQLLPPKANPPETISIEAGRRSRFAKGLSNQF